jgi:putative NADPH-quinone reductase
MSPFPQNRRLLLRKKILAILGSPHVNGATASMLDFSIKVAKENGYTVDKIDLYKTHLSFCTGCLACQRTGSCIQSDDIHEITVLLKNCDLVIVAAPVYWANIPAVLKNLFDRLFGIVIEETSTFPKPLLKKGKRYIFLTACNTPSPFSWIFGQTRGAVRAVDEFFKTAGIKRTGVFAYTNTKKNKKLPKNFQNNIFKYLKQV